MKKILTLSLGLFLARVILNAQAVSINTDGSAPDVSAILDVNSTGKGMLVPRMTTAQRSAITAANALLVFDSDTKSFWFFDGPAATWREIRSGNTAVLADADGNTKVQVEKNPNEDIVRFDLGGTEEMLLVKNANGAARLELPDPERSTIIGQEAGVNNNPSPGLGGYHNTFLGYRSGNANTLGNTNTFLGSQTGRSTTTGASNTASGYAALFTNATGALNTAHGYRALFSNTTGSVNLAIGDEALLLNATGAGNTAGGSKALYSNTAGSSNTAIGRQALFFNTTGNDNVAIGVRALYTNTGKSNLVAVGDSALFNDGLNVTDPLSGIKNTAIGSKALFLNTSGSHNTATGYQALMNNRSSSNTANGYLALFSNVGGEDNTACGAEALKDNLGDDNTACGVAALANNTVGRLNVALGSGAGSVNDSSSRCTFIGEGANQSSSSNFSNSTALGSDSRITGSDQVRIGNVNVMSIGGYEPWTDLSDRRFKKDLREDVPGLSFVLKLRPLTYHLDAHALAAYLREDRVADLENRDENASVEPDVRTLQSRETKSGILRTGFIAQEVEQAAQSIGYNFHGVDKPRAADGLYGLRYAEFVVPLVKAIQEQQAQISAQQAEIEQLKRRDAEHAALKTQLDKITAALQQAGISLEQR